MSRDGDAEERIGAEAEAAQAADRDGGPASPQLATIIDYFRTPVCLNACLDALRNQTSPSDEIVVVDNSAALDGLDGRAARGYDRRCVRAAHNLGFGAACNLGARRTRSDDLLFLNGDVVLCREACERLRSVAERNPWIDVVGPRVYGADGSTELSARPFPTAATGLAGRSLAADNGACQDGQDSVGSFGGIRLGRASRLGQGCMHAVSSPSVRAGRWARRGLLDVPGGRRHLHAAEGARVGRTVLPGRPVSPQSSCARRGVRNSVQPTGGTLRSFARCDWLAAPFTAA